MIFPWLLPLIRAACRKPSSRRASTRLRASRAYWVQPVTDRAMTALSMPLPRKPATAMQRIIPGKASRMSTTRMTTVSSAPPK